MGDSLDNDWDRTGRAAAFAPDPCPDPCPVSDPEDELGRRTGLPVDEGEAGEGDLVLEVFLVAVFPCLAVVDDEDEVEEDEEGAGEGPDPGLGAVTEERAGEGESDPSEEERGGRVLGPPDGTDEEEDVEGEGERSG